MYYLQVLIFMVLLGLATTHPTLSSLSSSVSIRDDSGKIQTEVSLLAFLQVNF